MFNNIIENAAQNSLNNRKDGDFIDNEGLLMCGKCRKRKQMKIEFPKGVVRIVGITCDCDKEEERLYNERLKIERNKQYIKSLYQIGLTDKAYLNNTFERDNGNNPELTKLCKRYVDNWTKVKKQAVGLLLYGDVGGGKSFYACCIANSLLKKGVRVLVTRLPDLVRNRTSDKEQSVNLKRFELIILDDIGVENESQTAFNIVDEIYRMNIPLIVTTNLTPSEIKNPSSIEKKRIYDRIIERCCVTKFVPVNESRIEKAKRQRTVVFGIIGANSL